MGRIIILSNNETAAAQLRKDIQQMDHTVIVVGFDNAVEVLHEKNPDLLVVDLDLPGGIVEVWQQLQYDTQDKHIATIALIPRERVREIELLSDMDDFILCPLDVRELGIRIKLILMQKHKDTHNGSIIKLKNLVIDNEKYEVTVDGWPVVLTLKEYELLRYLAIRRGRVITREMLLDQVWGYNYYGGTRTVDVHIGRLRTKIETGEFSFIRTVRGVGYVFTDEHSQG